MHVFGFFFGIWQVAMSLEPVLELRNGYSNDQNETVCVAT
jgi:hypothetical protein